MEYPEINRTLDAQYRETRAKNELLSAQREQRALEACPEAARLSGKRRSIIMQAASRALNGGEIAGVEAQIADLNAQIRAALRAASLPEDSLSPVYTCEKCGDTGYVDGLPCDCRRAKIAKLLSSQDADGETFANYDERVFPENELVKPGVSQRDYMRLMRQVCLRYADALPSPEPRNLLFTGKSGLGKTYFLHCILERARERNVPALMTSAYDAMGRLKDAWLGRGDADTLMRTELLLIDDLGTEPMLENVTIVQLFNLINERQRANLCTVLSTNFTLRELEARYTERVVSRLLDGRQWRQILFLGRDVRPRLAKLSLREEI